MSNGGRPNTVADSTILQQFEKNDDPAYSAMEISEGIHITKDGTYKRLRKLEDRGLVASKKISNGRGWWLTEAGKEYLKDPGDEFTVNY